MTAKNCTDCDGTGKYHAFDCCCCGGDGKEPTHRQMQDYAWRKANRQEEPVTVADAMKRFKCEAAKVFKVVGFLNSEPTTPYFFILGAPDMPPEKLEFDFDGE